MEAYPQGEGSSFRVTFTLYDEEGLPVTPTSIKFRVDCLTTGTTLREWTPTVAAEEIVIDILPADNAIQRDRNRRERRQLTFVANDDEATQFVDPDPVQWWVNNVLANRAVIP